MSTQHFPPLDQLPPEYVAENSSYALLATCISFLVVETTAIILLYTSRFFSGERRLNWHMEALMTTAYIVCLCKITIGLLAIHIGGAGHHLATLTPATITTALQLNTALTLVCPVTTTLTKMSILCLYNRIFALTSPRLRLAIRCTFALCVVTLVIQLIIPFANCKPFSSTWSLGPNRNCAFNDLALWKYLSIPNVLTTLVVVALPVPALAKLHTSPGTKVGFAVVLGVCVAAVVAAIMRFAAFLAVRDFSDFSYEQVGPLCWTIAESGTYMVAGVLPTLRPLVRKVFGERAVDTVLGYRVGTGKTGKSGSGGRWEGSGGEGKGREKADEGELAKKEVLSVASSLGTVCSVDDEEKGKP